jgi:phosphoribosylformimino-5-aminoimidazole carboxamide ribotide isomerase
MEVIPAIDILGGQCVRLVRGDFSQQTVYDKDPVDAARRWADQGAVRLHVVDLDGAREGEPQHLGIVEAMINTTGLPVQLGGGMRNLKSIASALDAGIDRCIISTAAARHPKLAEQLFDAYGEKIIVGLDATEGYIAIRGWTHRMKTTVVDFALKMQYLGARRVIFTDIGHQGMLTSISLGRTKELAEALKIPVIASGGISSLEDIRKLKPLRKIGVEGVVIGKALYTGAVSLAEAIEAARTKDEPAKAQGRRFAVVVHRTAKGKLSGSVCGMANCRAEAQSLHDLEEKLKAELQRQLKESRFVSAIEADDFVGVHMIEVSE